MKVIYAGETFPNVQTKAIFLNGPTPRSDEVASWRPDALVILESMGYDGLVFVPESRDGITKPSYDDQVDWETRGRNRADVNVFWVPRKLKTMPAFTTNVEFGESVRMGNLVLGFPPDSDKNRYLAHKAAEYGIKVVHKTLEETLFAAVQMIGEAAVRQSGECDVPLHIWRTASFQQWYGNFKKAGNRLDGARVETVLWDRNKKFPIIWILRANVWITEENRRKQREVVIARSDIACVVAFERARDFLDWKVVLVREFRSCVNNESGYVWEIPGGSTFNPNVEPITIASNEFFEETGTRLDSERFETHGGRQLMATLSAHKARLFSVELTSEEMAQIEKTGNEITQAKDDDELTFVEIRTIREIIDENLVDWSMLGMILSALVKEAHQPADV